MRTHVMLVPNLSVGGVTKVVLGLARGLISSSLHVELWTFDAAVRPEQGESTLFRFPLSSSSYYKKSFYGLLVVASNLRTRLCGLDGNAVVSAHGMGPIVLLALISKLFFRDRSWITCAFLHDSPSGYYKSSLLGRLRLRVLSFALRAIDMAVGVSRGVCSDYENLFPWLVGKIHAVPNGVDFRELGSMSKASHVVVWGNACPRRYRVVLVGRMADQKDYFTAIGVAELLRNEPFEFVCIGGGDLLELVRSRSRELPWFKCVGHLENPYPTMRTADAFLLTSKHEAFGLVLVEALALGLQIVSTDCPSGPREILEDGRYGDLACIGDCEHLAQLLRLTYSNKPLRLLRRASIRRARTFSIDNQVNLYLQAVDSCAC